MPTFDYKPIPPATAFHNSIAKIIMIVAGARSGKSMSVFAQAAADAVMQPDIWQRDINAEQYYTIIIGEPSYKMVKKIAWRHIMRNLPKSRILKIDRTDMTILVEGIYCTTEIIFFSYESGSEKIEGLSSVYRAYCDEFYQMSENFFHEIQTRLSERKGRLIMSGTPKVSRWISDLIKDRIKFGIEFYTWKTKDNPYFPASMLAKLKKLLPDKIFKRNFEAALDCFFGQIFEEFNESIHVKDFDYIPDDYDRLLGGQDWGYTHHGVFVLCGLRNDGGIDVLDEIAEKQLIITSETSDCWTTRVADKLSEYEYDRDGNKFTIDMCYCGVDEPGSIATYRRNNIPVKGAENSVKDGLLFIMTLFKIDENNRSRIRIHPRCKLLIEQIKTYKWIDMKEGSDKEAPYKENDDAPDALRYCLYSSRRVINDLSDLRYIKENRDDFELNQTINNSE